MKCICWLMIVLAGFFTEVSAQEKGIRFEQKKEWKSVVKKARKAKKLIFVDCYTKTCPPCRAIALNVFPREEVGDYFNAHFINVKYDTQEEADGKYLAKTYGIRAEPTLFFIDPETQQVVHQVVRCMDPEKLIGHGKLAHDPENNLSGLIRRYNSGERTPDLLKRYMEALDNIMWWQQMETVAIEYLVASPEMPIRERWEVLHYRISDLLSAPLREMVSDIDRYYQEIGKEEVDAKLENSIIRSVIMLKSDCPDKEAYQKRYTELVCYLQSMDHAYVPGALAVLYMGKCADEKDYAGVLNTLCEALKYNVFQRQEEKRFIQDVVRALSDCPDKVILQRTIDCLDARCEQVKDEVLKDTLMSCKDILLECQKEN